jgi:cell wall-associated NlpC family hydrolase
MHCWALVREIYQKHLSIALPVYSEVDYNELRAVADAVRIGAAHTGSWQQVEPFPGVERPFDVVVMRGWLPCREDGVVRRGVIHTGVITRPGRVMHTDMRYSIVEVSLSHPTVRRRLVACYRHASVGGRDAGSRGT